MRLFSLQSDLWDQYPGAYGSVRQEVAVLMGEAPLTPQNPSGGWTRRKGTPNGPLLTISVKTCPIK